MTRSELATLYDQLRRVARQPAHEQSARIAAETFNGWLGPHRKKLLQAAGYVARGEAVPAELDEELRHAAAAADARREVLRKAFKREF